jgi:hypothetical protein
MLSVALFAIGVTVLAASYVNVLNALDRVKGDQALEQDLALVRAQVLLEADRKKIEEGGDLPTLGEGDATWEATITPSEAVADLFRVDLVITLAGTGDAPEPRSVEQTLFLLRPQWSEPSDRDTLREKTRERLQDLKKERSP